MYNEYFGFKEAPFSIAPDPRYLYMTRQHREALAHLVYGLNSEGGCILLTGEVGTGKTTICRCLLEQIPEQANIALVLNPKVSEIELLETICDELKISYPQSDLTKADNTVKIYTDRIYQHLIDSNRKNQETVLIIDEAQNLSSEVLEQLRLLTNLETNQRKLLQIIILGQPELLDILARPEMRQLAQRITARFHLEPLNRDELKDYISHRLAVAGQNILLFPDNCIKHLYKLSNGVPRLVNIICDRALLGAYVENQHAVTPSILRKAAKEVFGELKNVEKHQQAGKWWKATAVTAVLTLVVIGTALFTKTLNRENAKELAASNLAVSETPEEVVTDISITEQSKDENATVLSQADSETTDSIATSTDFTPENSTVDSTENTANTDDKLQAAAGLDSNKPMQPPAQPSTQAEIDSISDIMNSSYDNSIAAYQALFNAWGETFDIRSQKTACSQAQAFSLSCLHKQGNLNSLKTRNRPAVLKLINSKGETRHIAIIAIHTDMATVHANNQTYTIKLAELDQYWYGQYTLLWRKPENYSSAISPGDSGKIVRWLNDRLIMISHSHSTSHTGTVSPVYNQAMVEQVKQFQLQHKLVADGIVGPVTIIHINSQTGVETPTLIKINETA